MNHRLQLCVAVLFCLLAFPSRSPAPLIYRPDEGWVYEKPGTDTTWMRTRAKDQLQVALVCFEKRDYSLAARAATRVVNRWPLSDYAPEAQYLVGRCYEAEGKDETAFKHYQKLLTQFPKMTNAQEVLQRQFVIANKYLGGQNYKLSEKFSILNYIALPHWIKDDTVKMYESIVHSAPYSTVAPQSQMNIGLAQEKKGNFSGAVRAYKLTADRYSEREAMAAEALYKAGLAGLKECRTAEYDQSTAAEAINIFTEFAALYPNDNRVAETQRRIDELKSDQARGSFQTARFYEQKKKWSAALIYYNEVLLKDPNPNSKYATEARQRIASIKKNPETK
jgi:outer membrane protein assembly factor BamD